MLFRTPHFLSPTEEKKKKKKKKKSKKRKNKKHSEDSELSESDGKTIITAFIVFKKWFLGVLLAELSCLIFQKKK